MRYGFVCSLIGLAWALSPDAAWSASPKAEDALRLTPMQKGVDCDRPGPEEAAKCKLVGRKFNGHSGWVVEDGNGTVLRRFVDTNSDNVVDQWSYFKDGVEVYRDIDSDFNGKADQYRWFNTAGTRWGIDKDENGTINAWKVISAEEAAAEAIAAMATRDLERFTRLTLTPAEVKTLGLGEEKSAQLLEKVQHLSADFTKLLSEQKVVGANTKWVQFNGGLPGTVPAGTDASTADVTVYENVVAVVETGGKHAQVQLGTLVRLGDAWRLIDVPHPIGEGQAEPIAMSFLFRPGASTQGRSSATGPGDSQKLLTDLDNLDKTLPTLTTPEQRADFNARRADLVEKLADQARDADEREMWFRQLADMVGAAVQSGAYPDGVKRLEALFEKLRKSDQPKDRELAAHARFRQVTVEFDQKMQAPGAEYSKIQGERRKALEQFNTDFPKSADAAEAMLQLAIDREWNGQEDDAKKWYARILEQFPESSAAKKAGGARTRLDSVGKALVFQGKSPTGQTVDLAKFRGSVVLVQFWATWCEPCKADNAVLKDLLSKYGSGFKVIGVSLDNRAQDLTAYLSENRVPWPQVFEEGGLDSRPANQLGIVTVPTMILVDQSGKVVSRNVRTADLEGELKKLVR